MHRSLDVFMTLPASRPRLALLLALAAGALLPLAFAPFSLWPLAPLSLLVLFGLWLEATPRQARNLGFAYGLGQFGVGAGWVYNSVHLFGEAIAPLAFVITLGFVSIMALYPALAGWMGKRAARRAGTVAAVLALPAAWLLAEWLRGWFLSGFPWLNLGASQTDSWLGGWLPVVGEYGTGALLALSVAGLLLALRRHWLWLGVPALVWGGGVALQTVGWTAPAGKPLSVAVVQGNIPQEQKYLDEAYWSTLDMYRRLSRQHWGTDLIVWPETAVPDFRHNVDEVFLQPLAEEALAHGSRLLVGVFDYDAANNRYYNGMLALPEEGGIYHKRHLVPFGEYLPLRFLLQPFKAFIEVPMADLSAGAAQQPPVQLGDMPVGVSICYEAAFAREVRKALPQAALLVNTSNDAWFGDSLAPHQHLQIVRVRAMESGRDLVRATSTGISAVVQADGELLTRSGQFRREVIATAVQPRSGATPYVMLGDLPLLGLALLVLGVVAWRRGSAS